MNYKLIYEQLCQKKHDNSVYTEKHRILPGCMGGKYIPENVVRLTPEEHYLAHLLLMKIYPEFDKLVYAAKAMTVGDKRTTNKLYGWLRREFASRLSKSRRGANNPFFGKKHTPQNAANLIRPGELNGMFGKKHDDKTRALISQNRRGIPSEKRGKSRTAEERIAISAGTKSAMSNPELRDKTLIAIRQAAKKRVGNITIWKQGLKRIINPCFYTDELKADGWVRSKALSL